MGIRMVTSVEPLFSVFGKIGEHIKNTNKKTQPQNKIITLLSQLNSLEMTGMLYQ